jgi:hypothetical protein
MTDTNFEEMDSEQQKRNEQEQRARDREFSDLRKVMSLAEGRRFIWRLLSSCGVFRSSMTGNSQTFFLEGRRDVGLMIFNDVMIAKPDAFAQMQKEYIAEQKQKKEESK